MGRSHGARLDGAVLPGAIFCYFIIIPAGFEWLIGETSAVATALPDLENYVNMELLFMIGFGVAFELPLIIFYLSVFHIVSYAAFRSVWRYVYVGLLAGSAVITPDGSPVTLGLMYGALLSLYEISLAIARVVITAREGKEGLFVSRLTCFRTTKRTARSKSVCTRLALSTAYSIQ